MLREYLRHGKLLILAIDVGTPLFQEIIQRHLKRGVLPPKLVKKKFVPGYDRKEKDLKPKKFDSLEKYLEEYSKEVEVLSKRFNRHIQELLTSKETKKCDITALCTLFSWFVAPLPHTELEAEIKYSKGAPKPHIQFLGKLQLFRNIRSHVHTTYISEETYQKDLDILVEILVGLEPSNNIDTLRK